MPVAPAFEVPTPRPLALHRSGSRWAPVLRALVARRAPSDTAPSVARVDTRTPEGTANLVLALGRRIDARGRLWVHVRLPVLPNNNTGWVPRDALGGYVDVDTHLFVDLEHLTATLFEGRNPSSERVSALAVQLGRRRAGSSTSATSSRASTIRSTGPVAFGTSARSAVLTDWPAGGFVGIHGTNRRDLLPGRVSHGCIRLRNEDILALARVMPVGTPVTIR